MNFTIKEVAKLLDIPATTIRYYDKEGLLPYITRKDSGYRLFSENDIAMLRVIKCLKKTGMSVKDMKQFSIWVTQGDASLEARYQMFLERKTIVENEMKDLQATMDVINYKCWYYETAIAAGTEKIHQTSQAPFSCED